jgi:hypothetical protein
MERLALDAWRAAWTIAEERRALARRLPPLERAALLEDLEAQ